VAKSLTFNSIYKRLYFLAIFFVRLLVVVDVRTRGANSLELPGAKGALSKSPGHLSRLRAQTGARICERRRRGDFIFVHRKAKRRFPAAGAKFLTQKKRFTWEHAHQKLCIIIMGQTHTHIKRRTTLRELMAKLFEGACLK
jgi:hypothetical protein